MNPARSIATLLVVTFLAANCSGMGVPPVSDEDTLATMVASTLGAVQALATPPASSATPLPPSPILPTLTATFTSTPQPMVVRLGFAAGATYTVIAGQVEAGQTLSYALQAGRDQPMLVNLDSTDMDASLSIRGQNGTVLLPSSSKFFSWQGLVPTTQDYFIDIIGGKKSQSFSLSIKVAARIQFAIGETRTVLRGVTSNGYPVSYVVHASQGQKMDIMLNVPPDMAVLSIWGFDDGQPYVRSQPGTVDFSFNLPATQDYIIEVVPRNGATVEYNMTVRIK